MINASGASPKSLFVIHRSLIVPGLTLGLVAMVGCGEKPAADSIAATRSALGGPTDQFVLLSSGPITLGDRDNVASGNVGTSLAAGSPFTLVAGHDDRVGGNVTGVSTELLDRAHVGVVSARSLTAPLATFASLVPFVAPPAVPAAQRFTAGSQAVSVVSGATVSLAPGSYGTVTVLGTLRLTGNGIYQFGSLTLGPGATLTAAAVSTVRLAGVLIATDRSTLSAASGLTATALRLVVASSGSNAAMFGNDVHLTGLLLVPAGTVSAGDRFTVSGAIAAGAIRLGTDAAVTFGAAFQCSTNADCNDNNVCTQDACVDGFCQETPVATGTPCNDGNACTQSDTCASGVCVGTNPVICTAADSCHVAGACSPATGLCSNPNAPTGTACSDGNACTLDDACVSGVCTGGGPVLCFAHDSCHVAGSCDPTDGICSSPVAADGAACGAGGRCFAGSCELGSSLTFLNSGGTTLFSTTVPTNRTFSYVDDDLPNASGTNETIQFTASSFPPGQQVIAYNFSYGFSPFDEGSPTETSDVDAGGWACLPTQFVALSGTAGQTASVNNVLASAPLGNAIAQVVRYVDGTCRVRVPFAPLFHELEHAIAAAINIALQALPFGLPDILSVDFFEVAQPQFQSQGSISNMGFFFEGDYALSGAGIQVAQLEIDPAFSIGLRASDGLIHIANINQNVTTLGVADLVRTTVENALATTAPQFAEQALDAALSPPLSQLVSLLQLPAGSVNTSCTTITDAAPSQECFDNVTGAIAAAVGQPGSAGEINQLASQLFGAKNFSCLQDPGIGAQCHFHPVFQAVNILPDSVEIVLAPDLNTPSNPLNDPLTRLISLFGPSGISQTVQLGNTPFTATIDCSSTAPAPSATVPGEITTVFFGDADLGGSHIGFCPFTDP